VQKKNPLRNKKVLHRINPYAAAYAKAGLGSQKKESGKPAKLPEAFRELLNE